MLSKYSLFFACLVSGTTASATTTDIGRREYPSETVDDFARRQLLAADTEAPAAQGLELVFTQGRGDDRSAYLLVEGRFGKDVKRGDRLRGWRIDAIAADHIELSKPGSRERLLLITEIDPLPPLSAPDPERR
jgi:hypothetical protein